MKNNALLTNNLREAFGRKTAVLTYNVYYNPATSICTKKSTSPVVDNEYYITVDCELYQSIDLCSNFKIVKGQLRRLVNKTKWKKLALTNDGKFITIKNNMIFVTDSTTDIDRWDYR